MGFSATRAGAHLDAIELRTDAWRVEPLEIQDVTSSFFERLPSGSATFDCALLMRDVPVTWHPLPPMRLN